MRSPSRRRLVVVGAVVVAARWPYYVNTRSKFQTHPNLQVMPVIRGPEKDKLWVNVKRTLCGLCTLRVVREVTRNIAHSRKFCSIRP